MKKIFTKSLLFLMLFIPASLFTMDKSKLQTSPTKAITLISSDNAAFHIQKDAALVSRFMSKNPAHVYHTIIDKHNLELCIEIMKIARANKHKEPYIINNAITEYIKKHIPKHKMNKLPALIKALYVFKLEGYIFGAIVHSFINKLIREYNGKRANIEKRILEKFEDKKLQSKVFADYYATLFSK